MRDSAAIGYEELSARAHFPSDVLKEAENGPGLPGLPIVTAYVRACEGDVPDWEERWRRLSPDSPDDPDLPIRPPGASPAAAAGARAGVGVSLPEAYDPDRIRAALRGGVQGGSDQRGSGGGGLAAEGGLGSAGPGDFAAPGDLAATARAASGWDTVDSPGFVPENGYHSVGDDVAPGAAGTDGDEDFSWWPGAQEPDPAQPEQSDSWFAPTGSGAADSWSAAADVQGRDSWSASSDSQPTETWAATPDEQRADSWSASAEVQARDSWSAPSEPQVADSWSAAAASPYQQEDAAPAGAGGTGAGGTGAGSAGSAAMTSTPGAAADTTSADPARTTADGTAATHGVDKGFIVRLVVLIIIAAMIGSALVIFLS